MHFENALLPTIIIHRHDRCFCLAVHAYPYNTHRISTDPAGDPGLRAMQRCCCQLLWVTMIAMKRNLLFSSAMMIMTIRVCG